MLTETEALTLKLGLIDKLTDGETLQLTLGDTEGLMLDDGDKLSETLGETETLTL